MVKRYHLFAQGGILTAASNAVKDDPIFDPRGGGLSFFSVPLQREADGPPWWGTSLPMFETGIGVPSFEHLLTQVFEAVNPNHNTGENNVQLCSYVHEDDFPGMTFRQGFDAALSDEALGRKPWALVEV